MLIEELHMNGRRYLTGYDIPIIESLVSFVYVIDGTIQLLQEDCYHDYNEKDNG